MILSLPTRGYMYAGLEFGAECYCGHKIQASNVSDNECSMQCKGEKSNVCGGANRLSIYRLELSQESARRCEPDTLLHTHHERFHAETIRQGCFFPSSHYKMCFKIEFHASSMRKTPKCCATYSFINAALIIEEQPWLLCGKTLDIFLVGATFGSRLLCCSPLSCGSCSTYSMQSAVICILKTQKWKSVFFIPFWQNFMLVFRSFVQN